MFRNVKRGTSNSARSQAPTHHLVTDYFLITAIPRVFYFLHIQEGIGENRRSEMHRMSDKAE